MHMCVQDGKQQSEGCVKDVNCSWCIEIMLRSVTQQNEMKRNVAWMATGCIEFFVLYAWRAKFNPITAREENDSSMYVYQWISLLIWTTATVNEFNVIWLKVSSISVGRPKADASLTIRIVSPAASGKSTSILAYFLFNTKTHRRPFLRTKP